MENIQDLIDKLTDIKNEYGNIPVYTNSVYEGDYGELDSEIIKLEESDLHVSKVYNRKGESEIETLYLGLSVHEDFYKYNENLHIGLIIR